MSKWPEGVLELSEIEGSDKTNGDPELAASMRRLGVKAPVEKIQSVNMFLTVSMKDELKLMERVVRLECGHMAVTKAQNRCKCNECFTMILNGEDYDDFRNNRD